MGSDRSGDRYMTHAAILLFALLLDAAMGEPRWLWSRVPHPAVIMGRMIGALDRRLNNRTRLAGVLAITIAGGTALIVGAVLSYAPVWIQAVLAAILLAQNSLVAHVRRVADDLRISLPSARRSVAMIVSRDTEHMKEPEVARSAIESAAENMSDGVIAPAFWLLLAGLPGLVLYKMVNTADSMIGYRTAAYENFGWAAARLDDLMNWVPARLTAAGFWLVGGCAGRWPDIAADARRHKSPNAGWPEAALSRSLGIALAGPRPYHGEMQDLPWVNAVGRREIGPAQIDAAIARLWRLWVFFAIVAAIAALLR